MSQSIPTVLLGVRIRKRDDGSIFITKKRQDVIDILDTMYARQGKGLSWMPVIEGTKYVSYLSNKYVDKICYIVGKGPDLDCVTETDFMEGSPILAINEAVHRICDLDITNDVYLLQRDTNLNVTPGRAVPVIPMKVPSIHRDIERYIHGFAAGLSVEDGLRLGQILGCTQYRLLAFDSCINKKTAYADCIGHKPSGNPKRFLGHKQKILKLAKKLELEVEFVKSQSYKHDRSACTPEPLLTRQTEHCEP